MDKKKIPLNAYLIFAAAVLLFLYILSFINSPSKDKRKTVDTALINPKYKNEIDQIGITNKGQTLNFSKNKNFWVLENYNQDSLAKLPADSSKLENMINQFSSICKAVIISEKNNDLNNFGLDSEDLFTISFYSKGTICSEINFGTQDFSQSKRYVKSGNNDSVFEVEDIYSSFLSVSQIAWTDPLIISQQILGKINTEDVQRIVLDSKSYLPGNENFSDYVSKLLSLRHGGVVSKGSFDIDKLITNIKLELGNRNEIELKIFPSTIEGEYIVAITYYDFNSSSKYSFYENISSWTYSKLNKI